jgi:hypothetical protein
MIIKNHICLFALLLLSILSLTSVAKPKPLFVYKSQMVFFARFLNKTSSERFKTLPNGNGMYKFIFYKEKIVILRKRISSSYRILNTEDFKDEVKYRLENDEHQLSTLSLYINDDDKREKKATINFVISDKNGNLVSTSMINCVKLINTI